MSMRSRLLALALLVGLTPVAESQQTPAAAPPARPEDVSSIEGIMRAVYDVISGPAGQARDWDRMRSLFVPGARLIPTGRTQEGRGVLRTQTVEEYITNSGPFLMQGFFEVELGRVQERYGNIVHAMSAYAARRTPQDAQPFMRGVNSFQLWYDGTRWWVVTIFWQSETPDNPIPDRFLQRP